MSDRTPPHSISAEQSVLGGLMSAPNAVEQSVLLADVQGLLHTTADFYRPAHQVIYDAICHLVQRREPTDPISVEAELRRRGESERVGGSLYLHTCIAEIPSFANTGYYAKIVAERAAFRRLVEVGTRIAQLGYEGAGDVDEINDMVRAIVMDATTTNTDNGELEHIVDDHAWAEIMDEIQQGHDATTTRVPSGFADLDALTNGGFEAGQLIVVGARPAVGKSTLALDVARGAIKAGHHAAFFGLEMSNKELRYRWLAAEAQVPLHTLRAGGDMVDDGDWGRIARAHERARDHHLWLGDTSTTVAQIRAACRRYQARTGRLDIVVVDYLQLMPTGSSENRQVAVSEASRALKLMAKELGVVVVALSQLNRKSEDRPDKRPQVSDLRESGAVEQDSDMVILIYREDVSDKDSPRSGEADLIVAKHRNGPTCDVTVAFQGHYSRFVDMYPG